MRSRRALAMSMAVFTTAALAARQQQDAGQTPYDEEALERFRASRAETLQRDDGWLTVAGLHFLDQGDNLIGADPSNDIVLDFPSVPPHAAVITVTGTTVRIRAAGAQRLAIDDRLVTETSLHGAFDRRPVTTVRFGTVSFFVHYSGQRLALRVRDQNSALRQHFRGLRWYAPDPAYRTIGTFTPYPEPKIVQIPNILGDVEEFTAVGTVSFVLGRRMHVVEAWGNPKRLWIVFRDRTSGRETYPSARFLYTPPVEPGGSVLIDFNYAQNPPCAYNPYTTCPLPPPQNRLPMAIAAGEMKYADTSVR